MHLGCRSSGAIPGRRRKIVGSTEKAEGTSHCK